MKVKLIERRSGLPVDAVIRPGEPSELPSMHNGWRFSFDKHGRKPGAKPFVLAVGTSAGDVEGCMIFTLREGMAFMDFLETAPHNKGTGRKYLNVAGCLIAYAFGLSLTLAKGNYNGLLFLQVGEETETGQNKLMSYYSKTYGAVKIDECTMMIADAEGRQLMETFLNQ